MHLYGDIMYVAAMVTVHTVYFGYIQTAQDLPML